MFFLLLCRLPKSTELDRDEIGEEGFLSMNGWLIDRYLFYSFLPLSLSLSAVGPVYFPYSYNRHALCAPAIEVGIGCVHTYTGGRIVCRPYMYRSYIRMCGCHGVQGGRRRPALSSLLIWRPCWSSERRVKGGGRSIAQRIYKTIPMCACVWLWQTGE